MMEVLCSSETSVLTRATWHNITGDSILHSHHHENLRSYVGCGMLVSVIQKLINSIWNKEELPDKWKESISLPVHKKGDKTDCNNYHGISLLSASYTILSDIALSWLSPYIDEIIGYHQCGF
jgi:hypothetical protein